MRFALGQISLSNISGGTLQNGIVPFPRLYRSARIQNKNALLSGVSSGVSLVSNNLGTVTLGDLILCQCQGGLSTSASAGTMQVTPFKSAGTAAVNGGAAVNLPNDFYYLNSTAPTVALGGNWILEVTTAGTLTLDLQCNWGTGTISVAANAITWTCYILAGS